MLHRNVRRFATSAYRKASLVSRAESANPYGIHVSQAQGVVHGLTNGKFDIVWMADYVLISISHWKYAADQAEPYLSGHRLRSIG